MKLDSKLRIVNAKLVNEWRIFEGEILIVNDRIQKIGSQVDVEGAHEVFDADEITSFQDS